MPGGIIDMPSGLAVELMGVGEVCANACTKPPIKMPITPPAVSRLRTPPLLTAAAHAAGRTSDFGFPSVFDIPISDLLGLVLGPPVPEDIIHTGRHLACRPDWDWSCESAALPA